MGLELLSCASMHDLLAGSTSPASAPSPPLANGDGDGPAGDSDANSHARTGNGDRAVDDGSFGGG